MQSYGLHMDLTWNGDPASRATAISQAKTLNAVISRNSLLWHLIEPIAGQQDWSRVDVILNELAAAKIEPLFTILGSPSWANGQSTSTSDYHLYVPTSGSAFSTWLGKYSTFVTTLVKRYKGKVKKWELWNEPNEHYFWKPVANLDQYAQWFTTISGIIKSIDSAAEISLGGLAGLQASGPTDFNGLSFLQSMYNRGLRPDNVAIHPYALANQAPDVTIPYENNFTAIGNVHDLMVQNGQGSNPIWTTEWGWNSSAVGESVQATYTAKSLDMIKTLYPYVSVATIFLDYDRLPQYSSGMYDPAGRQKPAGASYKTFALANNPQPVPPLPMTLTTISKIAADGTATVTQIVTRP